MYDEYNNQNNTDSEGTIPEQSQASSSEPNFVMQDTGAGPHGGTFMSTEEITVNKDTQNTEPDFSQTGRVWVDAAQLDDDWDDTYQADIYEAEAVSEDTAMEEANPWDNGSYVSEEPAAIEAEEIQAPAVAYAHVEDDTPMWSPEPEKYNTKPAEPKAKKRWYIPVICVAAALLVAVCALLGLGVYRLAGKVDSLEKMLAANDKTTILNIADQNDSENAYAGKGYTGSGTSLVDVVDKVMPSVVSITSKQLVNVGGSYWDYFFGFGTGYGGQTEEQEVGAGSGTIVGENDSEYLILTSYHVVEGSSSLYVTFCDDSPADGYIKSADAEKDIAIVGIPKENISDDTKSKIKIATLCLDELKVGEDVIVIGNALGFGQSVTTGIISALNREITVDDMVLNVIQTDAAINNGNSGGCMLNSKGEVIGISEAKAVVYSAQNVCYAIPIRENSELIKSLMTGESNVETAKGEGAYLGIRGRDIDESLAEYYEMPQGVYVSSVVSGSGAEAAGLQSGDIIVAMDGVAVTSMDVIHSLLADHNGGDKVNITLMRLQGNAYQKYSVDVVLSDVIG
ncbi:MAG: trypsin-like peptidase domain-containing protein [Parasporobacterium sp.]|nr:trypsin-like peptidase domain-containing protein [Parasporobacterium sp.]